MLFCKIIFIFIIATTHATSNDSYDNFRLIFGNVNTLQPYDMDQIVAQILAQVSCGADNPNIDCFNCLRSSKLQASALIGTTVDKREFGNVSLVIFCYLLNLKQFCTASHMPDYPKCYNYITNNREYLDQVTLEELINRISSIYHVSNNYFTNNIASNDLNCIEAGQLISKYAAVDSNFIISGYENINNLFADIIFMMYNRMKIGCSIPYGNWFIDQLYSSYNGLNDNINLHGLKQIIGDLSLTQSKRLAKSYRFNLFNKRGAANGQLESEETSLFIDDDDDHRTRRATTINARMLTQFYNRCYSAEELLQIYSIANSTINKFDFHTICPALVYMKTQGTCLPPNIARLQQTTSALINDSSTSNYFNGTTPTISDAEKYGFGTIAILIVTVLALLGIFLLPCFNKSTYNNVLMILSALAASTLFCDAMLHVLPTVVGIHLDVVAESTGTITVPDYVIKLSITIIALYLFWLTEKIMHHFVKIDSHSCSLDTSNNNNRNETRRTKSLNSIVSDNITFPSIPIQPSVNYANNNSTNPNMVDSSTVNIIDEKSLRLKQQHQKEQSSVVHQLKTFYKIDFKHINATAWMILVSDFIHNFADGMAIGASFAESVNLGISTTIAIICHQVPHELGNYAVLVKCGFTHVQALLVNLLSALGCFAGFYVGASISQNADISAWIFTVTAGMFFYIALVDILPTVMPNPRGKWSWKVFFMCNLAMFIGFAIMFLLVIFEQHIGI